MWIGPLDPPLNLMNSWKLMNPDFEYIYWNEEEIIKRGMNFKCVKQIDDMKEFCGKCDIMRWEILYKYGGVFVDADSICIEPFDNIFMDKEAFATYENETLRKNLVANGTMGFIINHPLCHDIIEWINDASKSEEVIAKYRAWISVGPALLTKFLETGEYSNFTIFPSYCYLPIHHTGLEYDGHRKVYGYQEWGSNFQSYKTMNDVVLPKVLTKPPSSLWFSVVVTSFNTERDHVKKCLNSIINQKGWFGIELVWCNDGSDEEHSSFLEDELYEFEKNSRFTKIVYNKTKENFGTIKSLHYGLLKCSNDIIFKINSNEIMASNRILKRYQFMENNPSTVVCGESIKVFNGTNNFEDTILISKTHHSKYIIISTRQSGFIYTSTTPCHII
jgi:hypothetical protein